MRSYEIRAKWDMQRIADNAGQYPEITSEVSHMNAKEIVKNKFWIVQDKGQNIGTISFNDEQYMPAMHQVVDFLQTQMI